MNGFGVTLRACATCGTVAAANLLQISRPDPLAGETYPPINRCRDRAGCQRRATYNLALASR